MSLRKRMIFLSLVFVTLISICLIVTKWGIEKIHFIEQEMMTISDLMYQFHDLRLGLERMLMGPHDYLINGKRGNLVTFEFDLKALKDSLNAFKKRMFQEKYKKDMTFSGLMSEAEAMLLNIELRIPEFKRAAMKIFDIDNPFGNTTAIIIMQEIDAYARDLNSDMEQFGKSMIKFQKDAAEYNHKIHTRVKNILILIFILSIICGTLFSFFYIWMITEPIKNLIATTRRIKDGDFTAKASIYRFDEIGELAKSFNSMVRDIIVANERFYDIFQGLGDAMCVIDKDENVIEMNKNMGDLLEISYVESIGRRQRDLFNIEICDAEENLDSDFQHVIYDGLNQKIEVEAILITSSDRLIPIELVITPFKREGEIIGIIECFKDISDRKEMEGKLVKEKERLGQYLEVAGVMFVVIDQNQRVTMINKKGCLILGYNEHEIVGKNWFDNFIPERVREEVRAVFTCLITGELVSEEYYENPVLTSSGEERLIAWHNTIIIEDGKGIKGTLSSGEDITERQKMQTELVKAQRLESLSILAGGIAHDFNNLLTAILGNISMVKANLDFGDENLEVLTQAENATRRATALTKQLLSFAKGDLSARKNVIIKDFLRDSISFALRGSNVSCDFFISDELFPVNIDEGQIDQVINNLVINAKQAMPDGGKIQVFAENFKKGCLSDRMSSHLQSDKDYIKIVIKDNGVGIPPELLPNIFTPFFTTKEMGSGLGLSSAYSIVKRHDGHIFVESEIGIGTTFYIMLPASCEAMIQETIQKVEPLKRGSGRILVMDDEEGIRNIAGMMLEYLGYEVEYACEGKIAVELYIKAKQQGEPFDLAIMDLTIPGGMGGKETIRELLKIDPNIKALVSSGYAQDSMLVEFKRYGFCGFISKPYDINELGVSVFAAIHSKGH